MDNEKVSVDSIHMDRLFIRQPAQKFSHNLNDLSLLRPQICSFGKLSYNAASGYLFTYSQPLIRLLLIFNYYY